MGRRIGRRLQDIEEIFRSLVKKQIIWDYKFIKKRQFMIVSQKPYNKNEYVKLGTQYLEIIKDHTYLGPILKIKIK